MVVLLMLIESAFALTQDERKKCRDKISTAIISYLNERAQGKEHFKIELLNEPENLPNLIHTICSASTKKREPITGKTIFDIHYHANSKDKSFHIIANIRRFCPVIVSTSYLHRHQIVKKSDIVVETREAMWPRSDNPVQLSQAIGMRTKRRIEKGRILTCSMLESVPMIERGDAIQMQMKSKNLLIQSSVISCQTGHMMDYIKVKDPSSNKYYVAQIVNSNTVVYKNKKN